MVDHGVPDHGVRNAMIFVAKDISDAHDLRPRNAWLGGLELGRDAACRFGNDLDAALHRVTKQPVTRIILDRFAVRRSSNPHQWLQE
jgi:hypothetical protein